MTHICVGNLAITGSDNGLSPCRRQASIWTNAGILLIGPLGIHSSEILIEINIFSFNKMHLKMSSAKWRVFLVGLNVLTVTGCSSRMNIHGRKGCLSFGLNIHKYQTWYSTASYDYALYMTNYDTLASANYVTSGEYHDTVTIIWIRVRTLHTYTIKPLYTVFLDLFLYASSRSVPSVL